MFTPKTERIKKLAALFPDVITELEAIFGGPTVVYIDLSNIIHWQDRLGWHFHFHRVKQLFDSFDTVKAVRLYAGTLAGNKKSEDAIPEYQGYGYDVHTKPVKIMHFSIDMSSVAPNSPALLERFIRKTLLERLNLGTIEFLNQQSETYGVATSERLKDEKVWTDLCHVMLNVKEFVFVN